MRKKRGPAKDKKTRIPKKYLRVQKEHVAQNLRDLSKEYLNFTRRARLSQDLY